MRLIQINPNVFANPEEVECVEQTVIDYKPAILVYVAGRPYQLDDSQGLQKAFADFMKQFEVQTAEPPRDYFAG